MRIRAQVFHAARNAANPVEWEDGAAYSERRWCFAVTDGAASAFRSRDWAEALVEGYTRTYPIFPGTAGPRLHTVRKWFLEQAAQWSAANPVAPDDGRHHWWEEHKARTDGTAAAFLGLCFASSGGAELAWEAVSIGDCCLFHVRGAKLLGSFPYAAAGEFPRHPALLPTAVEQAERAVRDIKILEGTARPGDRFILSSDAFSQWLLGYHPGDPSTWRRVDSLDFSAYHTLVAELRTAELIADDDTTLMIVRLD
jgi:hypothetical protein